MCEKYVKYYLQLRLTLSLQSLDLQGLVMLGFIIFDWLIHIHLFKKNQRFDIKKKVIVDH